MTGAEVLAASALFIKTHQIIYLALCQIMAHQIIYLAFDWYIHKFDITFPKPFQFFWRRFFGGVTFIIITISIYCSLEKRSHFDGTGSWFIHSCHLESFKNARKEFQRKYVILLNFSGFYLWMSFETASQPIKLL